MSDLIFRDLSGMDEFLAAEDLQRTSGAKATRPIRPT